MSPPTPAPDDDEKGEDAARAEMRAAIAETTNSSIDAVGGGKGGGADKARANSDAWGRVYADLAKGAAR